MNLAGGGNVMASDIRVEGASVTPGPPHILFSSAFANTGHPGLAVFSYNAYSVSADGQRFLIPQLAALAGGDDLADFVDKNVHRPDGFSVVVDAHIEGLQRARVVVEDHGPLKMLFRKVALVLGLEVDAPLDRKLELFWRLF